MADIEDKQETEGALEEARSRLYKVGKPPVDERATLSVSGDPTVPHAWEGRAADAVLAAGQGGKHIRFAGLFFGFAMVFFVLSLAVAGYFFYFGGNAVSSNKISLTLEGPTTIAGGDTVPLQLTLTNRNPVALEEAVVEVTFPEGTRQAEDTSQAYPRYVENLGRVESGETITRSLRAVVFGGAGETLSLPLALSYSTSGSNGSFTKKSSYALGISTTPLELSVGALSEAVSGKPLTLTITARSNATLPLENVVIKGTFPFGFTPTESSVPLSGSSFILGTLAPGATKTVTLTGTLAGQQGEARVFHFDVGTAAREGDATLVLAYMSQEATVTISSPFIIADIAINGRSSDSATLAPGSPQTVTVSYRNTLPTSVSNVVVAVAISGSAVDYSSITSSQGFYRSNDRTVVFSRDTDPSLGSLAPGASGLGTFSFKTRADGVSAPTVTFTLSVSGTRIGQTNVPETIQASLTKTAKVLTSIAFSAASLHRSGPIVNTGPLPPKADQATTYSILWTVTNPGSPIADGVVVATLPSYVTYTGKTTGSGSFSYDSSARQITWRVGNLEQNTQAQGIFQVSILPSTSQSRTSPPLTSAASFTGYDRFAGVTIRAGAAPATTEATGDPGYVLGSGSVQ